MIWGRVSTVWFKRLDAALKAKPAEGKTGKIAVREQRKFVSLNDRDMLLLALVLIKLFS